MANETTGDEYLVEVDIDGVPTWTLLPNQRALEIPQPAEAIDISSKNDQGWGRQKGGRAQWSINCGGVIDRTDTAFQFLRDNFKSFPRADIPIRVLGPDGAGGLIYQGNAQLTDFSFTLADQEAAEYSATFSGQAAPAGMWETVP